MFDYFYGQSGEMFSYFRVPKILFRDIKFKDLSTDAKTLYGILLDRMGLSVKNGWLDEQGRVYIIFPVQEVMRYLEKQNIAPSIENYEILYRGNLPTGKRSVPQPELLEQLYQKFNCAQPMDYHGHSLSVSDVILLNQAGKISAHYVDSIGFRELSGLQDKQERSSVLSQLKAKCDMPECNPTKCRKERDDHAI